jgi:membrane protease YdiL (CAAX protease family)
VIPKLPMARDMRNQGTDKARRAVSFILHKPLVQVVCLTAWFGLAVLMRVVIGGHDVAGSGLAGLVFAACLIGLTLAYRIPASWSWYGLWLGLGGTLVLIGPVALLHMSDVGLHARPAGNYIYWSLIVSLVAAAEEIFLRGVLYTAVWKWRGHVPAIILGAVLFTALHVPLYGFHVIPLDLAVGLLLGVLRYASGSWQAPAITHVLADLGAWWIV